MEYVLTVTFLSNYCFLLLLHHQVVQFVLKVIERSNNNY